MHNIALAALASGALMAFRKTSRQVPSAPDAQCNRDRVGWIYQNRESFFAGGSDEPYAYTDRNRHFSPDFGPYPPYACPMRFEPFAHSPPRARANVS
jgi:hypothetical protein